MSTLVTLKFLVPGVVIAIGLLLLAYLSRPGKPPVLTSSQAAMVDSLKSAAPDNKAQIR